MNFLARFNDGAPVLKKIPIRGEFREVNETSRSLRDAWREREIEECVRNMERREEFYAKLKLHRIGYGSSIGASRDGMEIAFLRWEPAWVLPPEPPAGNKAPGSLGRLVKAYHENGCGVQFGDVCDCFMKAK